MAEVYGNLVILVMEDVDRAVIHYAALTPDGSWVITKVVKVPASTDPCFQGLVHSLATSALLKNTLNGGSFVWLQAALSHSPIPVIFLNHHLT